MKLTDKQQQATDLINSFLTDPFTGGKYFTLTGPPGSGKTFLLNKILAKKRNQIVASTVSHAAAAVLGEGLGQFINVRTLASLLGMEMKTLPDGTIKFLSKIASRKPISKFKYVILDEVSMIDDTLFNIIMTEANKAVPAIKVIAVGDPYQLPPVEQAHDSKFFDKIGFALDESLRFSGPIGEMADLYRKEISTINQGDGFDKWVINTHTQRQPKIDSTGSGYEFTNDIHEMIERAGDSFKNNKDDINFARILAYKNQTIDILNRNVRKHVYGTDLAQFEPGEIVVSDSNFGYHSGNAGGPVIYNRQILKVKDYKVEKGPYGIPVAMVKFHNHYDPLDRKVPVVSTDDGGQAMAMYNTKLNELKQNAIRNRDRWQEYFRFKGSFAYFEYCYALNLYRAQGTTLSEVYLCEGEVMNVKPLSWKQKFQALYVAMTRPKKNLIFYNKEF